MFKNYLAASIHFASSSGWDALPTLEIAYTTTTNLITMDVTLIIFLIYKL